jgi:hypothetical protein
MLSCTSLTVLQVVIGLLIIGIEIVEIVLPGRKEILFRTSLSMLTQSEIGSNPFLFMVGP